MLKYLIVIYFLLSFIGFAHCQNGNILLFLNIEQDEVHAYDAEANNSQCILSLDSMPETSIFQNSIFQTGNELILEVYNKNQVGDSIFNRKQLFFDKKTFKIVKSNIVMRFGRKQDLLVANNTKPFKIIDTIIDISFCDELEVNDLVQRSRVINDCQVYTESGNIYMTNNKGMDTLLLHHYKGGGNSDMKWRRGYRFPDLSSDMKNIICYDTYYTDNERITNNKYIVEIDIKTLNIIPKIKINNSEYFFQINNIMYSPDDKYIFFSYLTNTKYICAVYNQQTSELIEIPSGYYILWIN